jgi:hypothetical protein
VKKSFRLFSILVAIGLLVGAFGIGSVMAKQVDLGDLGARDSSGAPMVVTVLEDDVEWTDSAGDDISYVRPDIFGSFYIQDDALETTSSGTASWGNMGTTTTAGEDFRITDGFVARADATTTYLDWGIATTTVTTSANAFVLDAAGYDSSTPGNTPLTERPTITVGTSQPLVQNFSPTAGTFDLISDTTKTTASNTTASFDFHVQDRYDASAEAVQRAKVYSTSDTAGELIQVWEVSDFSASTAVTAESPTVGAGRVSITVLEYPIVDGDDDGDLDNSDITVSVGGTALGTASSTLEDFQIDTVNTDTGVVTFKATSTGVALPAGAVVVSYNIATRDAETQLFRGTVLLSSDAASRGTNDDGIWVQDGDTVTVQYLDSDGAVVDSDSVTVDGTAPDVSAIDPADEGVTSVVNPSVSFEVTDGGSGIATASAATDILITINGTGVATSTPSFQAISNGFKVVFAQGTSWKDSTGDDGFGVTDGTLFNWEITASDAAGNSTSLTVGDALSLTIDTVAPVVVGATTGVAWDANLGAEDATETNTAIRVQLSESLDSDSVAASDFDVDGATPSSAVVGTDANDIYVYLTVSALVPDATSEVSVVGAVTDLAGNEVDLDPDLTTFSADAIDALSPTQTAIVSQALSVDGDTVTVTVDTDEKLASDGLIISVQGPSGAADNGLLETTSPSPEEHEGSVSVGAGSATGIYSLTIQSTDLSTNAVDNTVAAEDEAVSGDDVNGDARITIGSSTVTLNLSLDTGPIADRNFDGDLDGDDVSVTFNGFAIATSSVSADASARTVTLATTTTATVAASSAVVNYAYIDTSADATHWFEIDQSAPSTTFDPADGGEVENQSPFIRVIFDDDEYVGDTFTSVTLTAADITHPDGSVTDELDSFVVDADGATWIWAASDLTLGEYTLTASGIDTAGNEVTEEAATFDIVARDPYDVTIRPGWNLISLPGDPSDNDISTVITDAKIDAVLAYDPTKLSPWRTATRNAAGDWSGNLTSIDGNKGYWVHAETFDPIAVDIPALSAGAAVLPPAFAVNEGWNLIGVSVIDIATTTVGADDYLAAIDWARAYTFSTADNAYSGILPGTEDAPAADLTVGKGYFVYANVAGTVVP